MLHAAMHIIQKILYIYKHQGDRLDSKEQYCLASCQDRYLDIRKAVGDSLEKKQSSM